MKTIKELRQAIENEKARSAWDKSKKSMLWNSWTISQKITNFVQVPPTKRNF